MKTHLWIWGLFAISGLLLAGCTQVNEDDGDGVLLARDTPDVNIYEDNNPDTVVVEDEQPDSIIVEDNTPDTVVIEDERTPSTTNNYYYNDEDSTDTQTTGAQ